MSAPSYFSNAQCSPQIAASMARENVLELSRALVGQSTKFFTFSVCLGGVESLICYSAELTHA